MADCVVIAIPTFRRPKSLARLLYAIAGLKTEAKVSVLVADNDAEAHQGFDFCTNLAPNYRWPLTVVIEPARGISQVRNRLIANLEEASSECAVQERAPLLSVVVAGGGFAGVETIAGINDFLRESIKFYPNINEEMLRIVLVHPGEVILPELGPKLGAYAQKKLAQRGVDIRTHTRVTGVTEHEVTLSDGSTIPSNTVVWTAGTSPNPLLAALPCAKEHGRVIVNAYMEVPEWPGVWALGDCALVPDRQTGTYYPPTAQHALREGKVLAHNITATLRGGQKKPFIFTTLGQLAAIGKRTGVANILGMHFSGFLAWWLWRTIYLSKLPRLEKKSRVMLDWTLDLVFAKDLVQFITLRAPTVSQVDHGDDPSQM